MRVETTFRPLFLQKFCVEKVVCECGFDSEMKRNKMSDKFLKCEERIVAKAFNSTRALMKGTVVIDFDYLIAVLKGAGLVD